MYPKDIRPLTALRFAAAMWVLLYYFGAHLGVGLRTASGFVEKGYLGVDLFFVLSGFILSHVYLPQLEASAFNYRGFLWNRLSRVYPVHLITLAAVIVIWLVALRLHVSFGTTVFDPAAIPANLLLIHAWGTQPTVSWNFPSWSISAEWFAYLCFPLAAGAAARLGRLGAAGALSIVFALYFALFAAAAGRGVPFNDMTAQIGALRIVPAFLYGAVLYVVGRDMRLSERAACLGLAASLVWIVLITSLRLPDTASWPALGGMVFFLAETAKHRNATGLGSPSLVYLGEISYGMYMVHMPVDLVYFHAMQKIAPHPTGVAAWLIWAGVFVAVVLAAVVSFHLVEHPCRVWLRRRDPFGRERAQPIMG